MVYAYVQRGTVMLVERRTELPQWADDPYPIQHFYHVALLPYFKEIPADQKDLVRVGWLYDEEQGFHEPQAFEINPETGEMYLPKTIPAEDFYETYVAGQKVEPLESTVSANNDIAMMTAAEISTAISTYQMQNENALAELSMIMSTLMMPAEPTV